MKKFCIPALIIAAVAFILYANTIPNEYALDDVSSIKNNKLVEQGLSGVPELLTTHYRHGFWDQKTLYRPLSLVMFAIEWQFFPDSPAVYHLINILLYALTGYFLFVVLSQWLCQGGQSNRYSMNMLLPFVASLLFIAHPIHTEVVANIKSRDEVLALLLGLLCLYSLWKYLANKRLISLIFSQLWFFLALMSKENSLTIVAIIPLALFFFRKINIKNLVLLTSTYLIPFVIYLAMRYHALEAIVSGTEPTILGNFLVAAPDYSTRVASAFYVMLINIKLLIFPHPLVYDYSYNQVPMVDWSNPAAAFSILFFIGITIYSLILLRKRSVISFSILYFLLTMSIYTNIVVIVSVIMGERLLYMPSLGFCLILAWVLLKLFKVDFEKPITIPVIGFLKNNTGLTVILTTILLLFSFKTVTRNADWKDNETLFLHDLPLAENSCRAHRFYAMNLMNERLPKLKIEKDRIELLEIVLHQLQLAIKIYPEYEVARRNLAYAAEQLGRIYLKNGTFSEAVNYYELSIKYNPNNAITYGNFGAVYFNLQDYPRAIENYKKAIELDDTYVDGYMNLGSSYGMIGAFDNSVESFLKAIELSPKNPKSYYFLSITYRNAGDLTNAMKYMQLSDSLKTIQQ